MRLQRLTTDDLRRELARREKGSDKLLKEHSKLAKRLAAIDAELAELGVAVPARRRRKPGRTGRRRPGRPKGSGSRGPRAKNSMSLLEAIAAGVRKGATVSPAEAAEAARKSGYKSASPNFGMMVANTLAKAPMFKRLGRGQYLHKGGGAAKARHGPRRKGGRRKAGRTRASAPTRYKATTATA